MIVNDSRFSITRTSYLAAVLMFWLLVVRKSHASVKCKAQVKITFDVFCHSFLEQSLFFPLMYSLQYVDDGDLFKYESFLIPLIA